MTTFMPDARLASNNVLLCEWTLSQVWLVNDSRYPWIMLVPKRAAIVEIFDLDEPDQIQLGRESLWLAQYMVKYFAADKMNVAAIGNVVPQLHVHHVARFKTDATWPGTVWGVGTPVPYEAMALSAMAEELSAQLTELLA